MATTSESIQEIYIGLLGRAADADGAAYWTAEIDAGTLTLEQLRANIVNEQAEYASGLGSLTRAQTVAELYTRMFERTADATDLAYWVDGAGASVNVDQLVLALSNGASAADRVVLDNKTDAAEYYTANTTQANYTADGAAAAVDSVDGTSASVTASKTATDSGSQQAGSTFTLTTGADALTGTSNNDTFSAAIDDNTAANNTFTVLDTIDGGDGTDTLSLTIDTSGAGVAFPAANVSNVEVITARNVSGQTFTIDSTLFSGETTINSDRSTAQVDITGIAAGTTIGILGDASAANGTLNMTTAASVTSATIAVSGGTTGGAINLNDTADSVTALTISSAGAANTVGAIDVDADGNTDAVSAITINAETNLTTGAITNVAAATSATTLTASGAATLVTIGGTLDADFDTVDASGMTAGGMNVTLGAASTAFTGGTGADHVSVAALGMTANVDGGAGTDVVEFTASTNYATTAAKLSNFETLRGAGVGASYNYASISGLTGIEAETTAGTLTFTGLAADTGVTAIGNVTALVATKADNSGSSDSQTVTIENDATAPTAITLGDISVAGVETLNLVSNDSLASGTANTVSDFDLSTSVTTLNVSGNSDLTLTDITDFAASATVDASSFGNILTIGAMNSGTTVKGGSGADAVTVAFANLGNTTSFQGGTGDDTLTVTGNGSDVIDADFAALTGVDNLVIDSTTTTTATLEGFAQAAIATVDANSDGNLDISATALTTGGTINASALTNQGVDITATLAIAGTVNGTATLDLDTGAGNDTFTVTIDDTADTGDDVTATNINAGNGIDIINLTLNDGNGAGADAVTFDISATSAANADIITGFEENSATTLFDYNGTISSGAVATASTNADLNTALATGAAGTFIGSTDVANANANTQGDLFAAVLSSTAANLSANYELLEAQLLATDGALNGTFSNLDTAATNGQSSLIVLDNGTGTIILRHVNDTSTANTFTASELELVGVLTDSDTVTTTDFV